MRPWEDSIIIASKEGDNISIYKITNKINGKIYIGKCKGSIKRRFSRHIKDAYTGRVDTHFARAIRKYGKENFIFEQIDVADNYESLNQKEKEWILKLKSFDNTIGYNSTLGGDGGNTYINKSNDELNEIKTKIRKSKLGKNNPHSIKVKCRNIETKEELHFDTVDDMMQYFGRTNHSFISSRCNRKIDYLYLGIWQIAYENDSYPEHFSTYKKNRKEKQIEVTKISTGETKQFVSFASAERYFELKRTYLSGKAYRYEHSFTKGDYKVIMIE